MVIKGKLGKLIILGNHNFIFLYNEIRDLFINGSSNTIKLVNENLIIASIVFNGSNNEIKMFKRHPNLTKIDKGNNNKLSIYNEDNKEDEKIEDKEINTNKNTILRSISYTPKIKNNINTRNRTLNDSCTFTISNSSDNENNNIINNNNEIERERGADSPKFGQIFNRNNNIINIRNDNNNINNNYIHEEGEENIENYIDTDIFNIRSFRNSSHGRYHRRNMISPINNRIDRENERVRGKNNIIFIIIYR